MALAPDAQTLLTVVQTVDWFKPPARAHWREGFWPRLIHVRMSLSDGLLSHLLCRQDISEEDLFYLLRLDFRYTFNSSLEHR